MRRPRRLPALVISTTALIAAGLLAIPTGSAGAAAPEPPASVSLSLSTSVLPSTGGSVVIHLVFAHVDRCRLYAPSQVHGWRRWGSCSGVKAERLWFPAQGASPNPITYRLLAVGSSSSATASSSGTVVVGRQISARTQTTSNWSGEIATGVHSEVGARWVVPAVSGCDPATLAYSDTWVGLGTNRIVQGGTFQTCDPSSPGGSSYTAWVEAYPAPSLIAYTVAAGDLMQAEASQEGATATITVTDLTSGSSITRSFPDATPLEGAEWIEEDPTDMTLPVPSLYPLADFGSVAFTSMSLDGGLPTATPAPLAQDFINQTSLRLWAGSLQDRLVVRDAGS